MKSSTWDSHEKFALLIGPLREVARKLGYALAVHGSLIRDIDLIACPWTQEAVAPQDLAEAIRAETERINSFAMDKDRLACANPAYFEHGCPNAKPHGRRCWTFHLGGGPYIDLSVMPPRLKEVDDAEFDRFVQETNRDWRKDEEGRWRKIPVG